MDLSVPIFLIFLPWIFLPSLETLVDSRRSAMGVFSHERFDDGPDGRVTGPNSRVTGPRWPCYSGSAKTLMQSTCVQEKSNRATGPRIDTCVRHLADGCHMRRAWRGELRRPACQTRQRARRSRVDRVERLGKFLAKEHGYLDRLRRFFAVKGAGGNGPLSATVI